MAVTSVRLLGEVTALVSGNEVDLGSRRQRALFAVLAMKANRVVSRIDLIHAVWGADVPSTVESSVYTYVARLRHALEPQRSPRSPSQVIGQKGAGYQLLVSPRQVDAQLFASHLEEAKLHRLKGDTHRTLKELDAGLALWNGVAFDGLNSPFTEIERARLEELRLSALKERNSILISLGRAAETIGDLIALKELNPLREEIRALLMRAYYHCGRRAEALDEFTEVRRLLRQELGIEPDLELRRLHSMILNGEGRGDPGPKGGEAARSVPAELPPDISVLLGRERETRRLEQTVSQNQSSGEPSLLVVNGPPCVGKSALAVRFAHRVVDDYPEGQLYLNMRGFACGAEPLSAAEAARSILRSLGEEAFPPCDDASSEEWVRRYRSALAGRRLLLLLDNVRSAEQIRPLLPGGYSWLVLVTSRFRLPDLTVFDGASMVTLQPLSPDDALTLMNKLIRCGGGVPPDDSILEKVARESGHLPSALLRVSERLASRTPPAGGHDAQGSILSRSILELLDEEDTEMTSSVRSAVHMSYRSLSPGAAQAFLELGCSTDTSFDMATASSLVSADAPEMLRNLDELLQAHLLTRGPQGRFSMNNLVHAYARDFAVHGALAPREGRPHGEPTAVNTH